MHNREVALASREEGMRERDVVLARERAEERTAMREREAALHERETAREAGMREREAALAAREAAVAAREALIDDARRRETVLAEADRRARGQPHVSSLPLGRTNHARAHAKASEAESLLEETPSSGDLSSPSAPLGSPPPVLSAEHVSGRAPQCRMNGAAEESAAFGC
jgi:hypothetical protein